MGYFSIDKAEKLIPELTRLINEVRARLLIQERGTTSSNGMNNELIQLIREIESWGVVVRDVASGIVDIPAIRNGEPVYLCWRLGEKRIMYWHPLDSGLAGRKPIIRSEFLTDEEIYQKLLSDRRLQYEFFEEDKKISVCVDMRGWDIKHLHVSLIGRLIQIKWESEGLVFRREITLPTGYRYKVLDWGMRNGQIIIHLEKNSLQKRDVKFSGRAL